MVPELALPEHERLVADVRYAGEVVQVAEQLSAVRQPNVPVVLLSPDERAGVHGVLAREALRDDLLLEMIDAAGNIPRLVVEHERHEVKRRMGLVLAEVPGFVYEDAQLCQKSPRIQVWRGYSPRPRVDQGLAASPVALF